MKSVYLDRGEVCNISKVISKNSSFLARKTAVIETEGRRITYSELNDEIDRIGNFLSQKTEKGDRVFVLMQNEIETLEILLSCLKTGRVYTPANYRLSSEELAFMIDDVEPVILFYDSIFDEKVSEIERKARTEPLLINVEKYSNEIRSHDPLELKIETKSDELAMILFTAGTTGRPKGVMHSHRSLFYSSIANHLASGITSSDIYFGAPPLFHAGGITCFQLSTLMVGGTIILQKKWSASEALKAIKEYSATFFFGIATQLKMMTQVEGWEDFVKSLKAVCGGGEPQPRELREEFARLGIKYLGGYGLTESGATGVCGPPTDLSHPILEKGSECMGIPPPLVEVKIVDEEGNEVDRGVVGEIVIRSEPVGAMGYWKRPEENAKKFKNGWIFTGDVGMIDEDGYVYVMGRKDDMIISGGENIYPAEIERAIYSHPKVSDVVVVRGKHETWGQTPKAIVVPKRGETITPEEIQEHVSKILGSFKKPRKVVIVEDLPKAETGKIDKRKVKELYEEK